MEDADAIADILVRSWQAAYAGLIDPEYLKGLDKSRAADAYRESIFRVRDKIYVCESGSAVHGFILGNILTDGPFDCEVKELYVHPDQQGKGVGKNLLAVMSAFFKEAGLKRMIIWALLGAKNNGFYSKMGGIAREEKEMEVGGKKYPVIGFDFPLDKEAP